MSPDIWEDGDAYERYVGRWSRRVADDFLRWLAVGSPCAWLDFGCGTGALTQRILATASPRLVIGCDRSVGYTRFARARTADGRAEFQLAELPDLPRTPGGFDAVVSGLVLNFLTSPIDGVTAMASRVRAGGVVAAYVWDYAEGMQLLRIFWDAAVRLDPQTRSVDEGVRFQLCRPEPLQRLFEEAGLLNVHVRPIDVPTRFQNFDDYWSPFTGGQGPAPGYAMSLPAERREQLREAIAKRLPIAADLTISLTARAWAVSGVAA